MSDRKLLILFYFAVILGASFFLYNPSLDNDFLYDDLAVIVNTDFVLDSDYVNHLFSPDYALNVAGARYYAPMTVRSYIFDTRGWEVEKGMMPARNAHATNMALCIAVNLLLFAFFLLLTGRVNLAAFAAALFVAHPMHAENVNYVYSRPETLSAFFVLCAILIGWIPSRALWARVVVGIGVFFAALFAMLSGRLGLAAVLLLPLADLGRIMFGAVKSSPGHWKRRFLLCYLPAFAALAALMILRWRLFGGLMSPVRILHPWFIGMSASERLFASLQVLSRYFSLSFIPFPSTVIYNPLAVGEYPCLLLNGVGAAVAVAIGALAMGFLLYKRTIAGFGMLWFAAAILPSLPFLGDIYVMSEAVLFLPSAGICLLAAAALFALADTRQPFLEGTRNTIVPIAAALILTVFSALGFTRGLDWKTAPDLWRAEIEMHPKEETVLASAAFFKRIEGKNKEALKLLEEAMENYAHRPQIYKELSQAYFDLDMLDEGEQVLRQALANDELTDGNFFVDIGQIAAAHNLKEISEEAYLQGAERDPENWITRVILGDMLFVERKFEEAIEQYNVALNPSSDPLLAPTAPEASVILSNRARSYLKLGDLANAEADAKKARRNNPLSIQPYMTMADCRLTSAALKVAVAKASGNPSLEKSAKEEGLALVEEAIEFLKEGISANPTATGEIYLKLAKLYNDTDRIDDAINIIKGIKRIPDPRKVGIFLAMLYLQKGDFDNAGILFSSMLDDPVSKSTPYPWAGMGYCNFQKGEYQRAKTACEVALKIHKYNSLALLLYRRLTDRGIKVEADLTGLSPDFIPTKLVEPTFEDSNEPSMLPLRR